MTPEIETEIKQREAMLRRQEGLIRAANEAAKAAADEAAKLSHLTVVARVGERVKEIKDQIATLRGKPSVESP